MPQNPGIENFMLLQNVVSGISRLWIFERVGRAEPRHPDSKGNASARRALSPFWSFKIRLTTSSNYAYKIRRSTDSEALKLGKGSSGVTHSARFNKV